MCKAVGKRMQDYTRLEVTHLYLQELSSITGLRVEDILHTRRGGIPELQGTWIHPDASINLACWLSPRFAVLVSIWVRKWIEGEYKQKLPYHLERYLVNRVSVPNTHFSMLTELTILLLAPLESSGYTLPENMLPDISEGLMFSNWLRKEKGLEPKDFPTYLHKYQDGRMVKARLYPNSLLPDFREHFHNVWLPTRAAAYFAERDPKAIQHLPKLLN